MRAHRLKTHTSNFRAIYDGTKTAELRFSGDRDFQVGDYLLLEEYDPDAKAETGDFECKKITHILTGLDVPHGLKWGFVVLSMRRCDDAETAALRGRRHDVEMQWLEPATATEIPAS